MFRARLCIPRSAVLEILVWPAPTVTTFAAYRCALRRALVALTLIVVTTLPIQAKPASDSLAETLSLEAPLVQLVFDRAALMERSEPLARNQQYAARLYCVAARLGSVEAQYRLGKMILAGWGMSKSPGTAVALFRMAASQGHEGATWLLAVVDAAEGSLPRCMESPGASIDIDADRGFGAARR